jgi:plastocyanin
MSDPMPALRPLARRMVLRAALTAGTTLAMFASAGRTSAAENETVTVSIDNFAFAPTDLTVAPGTTVVWTNHDDIPHTVTSTEGVFKSHALDTDDSFSFTFEKVGSYRYFCSLHPHMVGMVRIG